MFHKSLLAVVASAAVLSAVPALAQGKGGGGGQGGPPPGAGSQGGMNSQGPANASANGIANANQNSVLFPGTTATSTVASGALSGLSTGATLYSNGTAVGTVQQIRTTGQGSVAVVIVKGSNGHLYGIPANKLTFTGGTLSTTSRLNGINGSTSAQARVNSQGPAHASATGIAHANQNSVLATTSLPHRP